MRHAIVRNGLIENITEWDGARPWQPPAGTQAVPCDAFASIGWLYDAEAGTFAPPQAEPPKLRQVKAAALARINAAFATAVAAGVPWGGKVLQIDDDARQNIAGQATRALAAVLGANSVTWPSDFAWRMADNSYLRVTAIQMLEMAQAASDRYVALRFVLGAKKDAVVAAADIAAVEAIDPTKGWPSP